MGEEGAAQIADRLSNNLSILYIHFRGEYYISLEAILERNIQGKFNKVCKVMVVGEARSGKTSLVRSLKNQPFDENQSITKFFNLPQN